MIRTWLAWKTLYCAGDEGKRVARAEEERGGITSDCQGVLISLICPEVADRKCFGRVAGWAYSGDQ